MVRGMTDGMTIGERVAFYRNRRGMSQEVLAGLVGRTADWLRKVEHNRISLDRLSIIRRLASVLDVPPGDLIGEPTLMAWTEESSQCTVSELRVALMGHRQFLLQGARSDEPIHLEGLERELASGWESYQQSRYSRLSRQLPPLITGALIASQQYGADSDDGRHAHWVLASVYQLATGFLTKIGEADLASLSATKGLSAAHASGSELMVAVPVDCSRLAGHWRVRAGCRLDACRVQSSAVRSWCGYARVFVGVRHAAAGRCDGGRPPGQSG